MIISCETYHFERPDTPDPDLQLAWYTIDILKFDSFPPASPCRLAPEEEKLLSHSNNIGVGHFITLDVGTKSSESNAADDSLVGFICPVTPAIVMIEASVHLESVCR